MTHRSSRAFRVPNAILFASVVAAGAACGTESNLGVVDAGLVDAGAQCSIQAPPAPDGGVCCPTGPRGRLALLVNVEAPRAVGRQPRVGAATGSMDRALTSRSHLPSMRTVVRFCSSTWVGVVRSVSDRTRRCLMPLMPRSRMPPATREMLWLSDVSRRHYSASSPMKSFKAAI